MRDVNDANDGGAPDPGGWLHLDVSRGASGTMIAAALLDLGLEERVVREAFDQAGLHDVGLRALPLVREGLAGLQVEITDDRGRPLASAPPEVRPRPSPRAPVRRRHQAPHVDVRPPPEAKAMGLAEDAGGAADDDEDERGRAGDDEGARVFSLAGEVVAPPPEEEPPKRSAIREWLLGKGTTAASVLAFVAGGGLPPLDKALAVKVLRRALEARARVEGSGGLHELPLAGDEAVLLLAEAVACAALVGALSPARVSASAVALDVAAAPWTEAVLEGARVREEERGFSPTTPLGAAVVRALAYRFGARGDVTLGRAGNGHGPSSRRGELHVCRALYGQDRAIASRGGEGQGGVTRVEALLGAVERPALVEALRRAGAEDITSEAVLDAEGGARTRVTCCARGAEADDVARALFAAGAREVLLSTAERRRPEAREVTVTVGRANRKELVRLTEFKDQGQVLSVALNQRDLDEAAARLAAPRSALEREALVAYEEARARGGSGER